MNHPQPYRPPLSPIPADPLRGDPCDPRRPMNPLAGIYPSHRNYPGHRHSSPDGDSLPFRITATHPVVPQPIMDCLPFRIWKKRSMSVHPSKPQPLESQPPASKKTEQIRSLPTRFPTLASENRPEGLPELLHIPWP